MFRQKSLLVELLYYSFKKSDRETAEFINELVKKSQHFSIDDLSNACLSGLENPVKKLFDLAKKFPQLNSALPDINKKNSKGNTLLFTVLLKFCYLMKQYVDQVSDITDDPECKRIPSQFANHLRQLQKLSEIIQYLLNKNAHETATSKQLFKIANRLSETKHTEGKKHFIPLKNMVEQINACRNHQKYYATESCTFFCIPVKMQTTHLSTTKYPGKSI